MKDKERIEELERRVRELEARPYWPIVILQPYVPPPQPTYDPWYPWQPGGPFYIGTSTITVTS